MLAGEKEGFLEDLQELGVVDITRSSKPVDHDSALMLERISRAKKTLDMLDNIDYTKDASHDAIDSAKKAAAAAIASSVTAADASKAIVEIDLANAQADKLADLKARHSTITKEIRAREPWGEYDMDKVAGLQKLGYQVRWYCTDHKAFDPTWGDLVPLQVIEDNGSKVWFITISPASDPISLPIQECPTPAGTATEAKKELASIEDEMVLCKAYLLCLKADVVAIREALDTDKADLDRYLANQACESAAEDMISVITGFAPKEDEEKLCAKFDEMGVFYLKDAAVEEDNPPIKLKNNWFARQFEVLTGMYGMPVYSEFDPTAILGPFFLLFFAMCMGDGGYGLILILFGLCVKKNWIRIGMFKGLGNIIMILGTGTLLIGTLLGTAFGVNLAEVSWIPEGMKHCFLNGKVHVGSFGDFDMQMILALAIGVFHICLAMTVKAICYTKRFGFRKTVSTWGWLLLILGGIITFALASVQVLSAEAMKWTIIAIGSISALGIFLFNTPGRNPIMNIGSGLWDTYNMATGILGDVLSYIRLYALGLAGGMLGSAFNDLANMVLGSNVITWIPFVLILLLGHVLNIAMSALGAFVHPLRLTFVEYFKNSGYEGKGAFYRPLTKKPEAE